MSEEYQTRFGVCGTCMRNKNYTCTHFTEYSEKARPEGKKENHN